MVDVHLVHVYYFGKDDLLACLAGLFATHQGATTTFSVTVVDNTQNRDGITEWLPIAFPQVRLVQAGGNVGFGRGCNLGFAQERARYAMTLNADVRFDHTERALDGLVAYMDSNPHVGACGPQLRYANCDVQRSAFSFALPAILVKPLRAWPTLVQHSWVAPYIALLQAEHLNLQAARTVDWLLGAAVVLRQEALDVVGAFDPRYWLYFDDCDLCHSLWERGWEVHYVPHITLTHVYQREGHSSTRSPFVHFFKSRAARAHVKSWLQYLWKWRGRHRSYAH